METNIEIEESKSKNKGFTLIELLIVIVILGILAAVTVFAVRGITDKGTTSACASDKATIATAAEAYFAQYGGTYIPDLTHKADGTAGAGVMPTNPATGFTTLGATADATLVNAGFLRATSTKYTLTVTTAPAPVGYADGKGLTAILPCT